MADDKPNILVRWVRADNSPLALYFASVAESTVVPIPIEFIITPMMLADRARIFIFALVTLLGCITGSTIAYFTGFFFFETVGEPLIEMINQADAYERYRAYVEERGALATAFISITPIPLVTAGLGAGAAKMNYFLFILIVSVMRTVRYFGIGAGVYFFGASFDRFLKRYFGSRASKIAAWVITAILVVLAVYFAITELMSGSGELDESAASSPSAAGA